jgi:Icc-related predicted phosphoesterase
VGHPDLSDPSPGPLALVLADQPPYVPLERLLERHVDVVLCLGDLSHQALEPLGGARVPKLGVHGNHDDGDEFTGLGVEDVHLRRVDVADLCFGGFSGSVRYRGGLRYAWTQRRASRALTRLGPVDVLIAHSPPAGVNDDPDDPAHAGLDGLRAYVERERPALVLHGHTYPILPASRLGPTQVLHVRGHRFVRLPMAGRAR